MPTTWNPSDASSNLTFSGGNLTVGCPQEVTIGVALDMTHSKVWFFNPTDNGGQWNNAAIGTQNPATNTGGRSISGFGTPMFPAWSSNKANIDFAQANFGATTFANTMPSGFSSANTASGTTMTWNPSDKGAGITLSGGNLIAQGNSGAAWNAVRATAGFASGLIYWEFTVILNDSSDACIGGVLASTGTLTNFVGSDSHGLGYQSQGSVYNNGSAVVTLAHYRPAYNIVRSNTSQTTGKLYFEFSLSALNGSGGGLTAAAGLFIGIATAAKALQGNTAGFLGSDTISASLQCSGGIFYNNAQLSLLSTLSVGQVVSVAIDIPNKLIWFFNPANAQWNNGGSANPATGAGSFSLSSISGAIFIAAAIGVGNNTCVGVLNAGATTFARAIPSGFAAWDPSGATSNVSGFFFAA